MAVVPAHTAGAARKFVPFKLQRLCSAVAFASKNDDMPKAQSRPRPSSPKWAAIRTSTRRESVINANRSPGLVVVKEVLLNCLTTTIYHNSTLPWLRVALEKQDARGLPNMAHRRVNRIARRLLARYNFLPDNAWQKTGKVRTSDAKILSNSAPRFEVHAGGKIASHSTVFVCSRD
jgi:hypothetical protein